MSALTKQALEDALQAHVADELRDHFVSDFVMVVRAQAIESDLSQYRLVVPSSQAFHVSDGLLSVAGRLVSDIWASPNEEES